MAVSAVWRLVYFLAPCPSEPKEQTAAHRRDALCPSPKIQKQAAFGIKTQRAPTGRPNPHKGASTPSYAIPPTRPKKMEHPQGAKFVSSQRIHNLEKVELFEIGIGRIKPSHTMLS